MKQAFVGLSKRYGTALRKHLEQASHASLQPALSIGRRAVVLGLETLELARIHEHALATLELPGRKIGWLRRAKIFFTAASTPIEETHRPAQQGMVRLSRMRETLGRRTQELAASHRQVRRDVVHRKVMEAAAKRSGRRHKKSLEESLALQKHLRQLTHRVLAAQEAQRSQISHELQDEIAQTLLGINVGLLSLQAKARSGTWGLKQEIASTQRLVASSAQSVRRFARELNFPKPAAGSFRHEAMRGTPAAAGRASRVMKTKIKPEHRPGRPTQVARPDAYGSPAPHSFPVIAMAASAGGLHALSVILGGLPADFPAAIAIVMHLSPHHKSILAEILDGRSHLEVKQAKTGDFLCHSCVFVAPPNHHLSVAKDGRLKLSSSAAAKVNHARPSAEPLFVSVAEVYQERAIAVVLTGGDGDGSFGVQIIKDKGGQVIAQDRPTSENFSMPETSIQTGDVDFILPLNEIAPKLMELAGAACGKQKGRTTARLTVPAQALAKLVRPHYSSGTKDVMIQRGK